MNSKNKIISPLDGALIVLVLIAANGLYNGFDNLNYDWQWDTALKYLFYFDADSQQFKAGIIARGFASTLRISFFAIILSLIIGIVGGGFRASNNYFLKNTTRIFVEFIRNTPQIVLLFIFYFFLSSQNIPFLNLEAVGEYFIENESGLFNFLLGDPQLLKNFVSGVISLAIFESAYVIEIIRSSIQSIDKGQFEAGKAMGLSKIQTLRRIILPQAITKVLPSLSGQMISLIKDSSILSIISIQELTYMTLESSISTRRIFEVWTISALLYLSLCLCLSIVFRNFEQKQF